MPGDFTKQADAALRLITKNGQPIIFRHPTSSFNPITGGDSAGASYVSYSGQGVRLSSYKGTVFEQLDNAFKVALTTGKATILLVAAKGLAQEPVPGDDVILVDGSIWTIIGLTVLNPAGLPIIHTMGVLLK